MNLHLNRGTTLFLCLLLILGAVPVPVSAENIIALNGENGDSISTEIVITQNTSITVTGTVYMTKPITIKGGNVTISGGGVLKRQDTFIDGNLLNVEGVDTTVALSDVTLDGGSVEVGLVPTEDHVGISLTSGTITMKSGAKLTNHHVHDDESAASSGSNSYVPNMGGSAVRMAGGTFNMEAGSEISGCRGINFGNIYIGSSATFNMSGGTIQNNDLSPVRTVIRGGGAFYVVGTLNITGGEISENNAGGNTYNVYGVYGGAIYCADGTLKVSNCTFKDNGKKYPSVTSYGKDIYLLSYKVKDIDTNGISITAYDGGTEHYKWGNLNETYTITLDPREGTVSPPSVSRIFGDVYGELPAPTRSGYVFDGWYTEPGNAGSPVHAYKIMFLNGSTTVYAHWSEIPTVDITGGTAELVYDNIKYDGTEKKPGVTSLKLSDGTVVPNNGYTVEYADNIYAGTATVIIKGKENYFGTIRKTFTIGGTDISSVSPVITLSPTNFTYRPGTAQAPGVTVTVTTTLDSGVTTLTQNTDYVAAYQKWDGSEWVSVASCTDVGTYRVVVNGTKNYTGTATSEEFTITAKTLGINDITIDPASYPYTGSPVIPTVKYGSNTLTAGVDYTVTYDPDQTGSADNDTSVTAVITLKGNYSGNITKQFTINKAIPITDASITLNSTNYTYTGSAIEPSVTVVLDGNTLVNGTDYELVCSNHTNPGTATVTVVGKGRYSGTASQTVTYTITKAITASNTQVLAAETYAAGSAKNGIDVAVTVDGVLLKKGTDYTLTFNPNDFSTEAGSRDVTVTVSGQGGYSGSVTRTLTFRFVAASYTVTWKNADGTLLATGSVDYGQTPNYNGTTPMKAADAQYTYTFSGWTPSVTPVSGEITYTATYSATVNTYTVTWKNDDESVIDTTTVSYGALPTHAEPIKSDDEQYTYRFTGWSPEPAAVTSNVTYTATYGTEAKVYTVTWKNEGSDTPLETDTGVAYGSTPSYDGDTPAKAADAQYTYTFSGWSPAVTDVTGNVTYTAQFSATLNTYTVTWSVDGTTTSETYAYGEMPSFKGSTAKDADAQYLYAFSSWSPEPAAVTGDVTYTAAYTSTPRSYTVTFYSSNQRFGEPQTVSYGETVSRPSPDPTNSGYIFTAWYTADHAAWDFANNTVTGDLNLYAEWTAAGKVATPVLYVDTETRTVWIECATAGAAIYYTTDGTTPTEGSTPYTGPFSLTGNTTVKVIAVLDGSVNSEVAEVTYTSPPVNVTVTFDANGGSVTETTRTVTKDGVVGALPVPSRDGYRFDGWFTAASGGSSVTGSTVVPGDVTYYAHWTQNDGGSSGGGGSGGGGSGSGGSGGGGSSGGGGGGTPADGKTGENTGEQGSREFRFADVKEKDWFYEAVAYVFNEGFMEGTSEELFSPAMDTSRGMVATILYRMENEPETVSVSFDDVPPGEYYTEAVAWASENGVVDGYDLFTFGPEDSITREQLAAMLYRYAALRGADVSGRDDLRGFWDGWGVSGYALDAVQWAVSAGLLEGYEDATLRPGDKATRAEIAMILQRYCTLAGI